MEFTTRPDLTGHFGIASSTHWLASQTAMRMLEIGGNAFDAAVAGGLVLQVAEPHLNGPLGEVPILLHHADSGATRVVCGQGPAPAGATIDAFRALGIDQIPGTGLLATAIPGAFDAWMLMLRDYGTLDLAEVMQPAIDYATHGVPMTLKLIKSITQLRGWFATEWPENAAIYLDNGEVPSADKPLKNPILADMYTRILHEAAGTAQDRSDQIEAARNVWKTGFVAESIDRFCRTTTHLDVTGQRNGGLLTGNDMVGWSAFYEDPFTLNYRGHTVCKTGPWGQGPVLLQGLALAEQLEDHLRDPNSADFYHTLTEIMKLTYADRETYYGDPNVVQVPMAQLLGRDYAQSRAKLVGDQANNLWRPGDIPGFGYPVDYHSAATKEFDAEALAAMGLGEPTAKSDNGSGDPGPATGDTCQISVVDRWGNMVSATPSGGWMESSPVIPELGVCLGTRLQMMSLIPGAPDALSPGKRPRSTLSPTIVLNDAGKPYMALGTPGGDKQDQWQLAFLVRHLLCGMSPQQANDALGFSSTHWPGSFYPRNAEPGHMKIEARASREIVAALTARGHVVTTAPPWSEGWICSAMITASGMLSGSASARGMQAYAIGR
ncbi:gamma-glutamyltransferase family protein [uncultured Ruegeria sp.]|uniref:gamma-glutamyltransferase family protein n=1 Tax=uncultured Ruegeria sp. TaxID=259304 RepID=UPI00262314CE|nr:gamma-glutamyltransferase [uncultured Ruegeria sp.]